MDQIRQGEPPGRRGRLVVVAVVVRTNSGAPMILSALSHLLFLPQLPESFLEESDGGVGDGGGVAASLSLHDFPGRSGRLRAGSDRFLLVLGDADWDRRYL